MDNVEETIRNYILTEFLPGESAANLKDDTPLRTSGILDSMATLNLVTLPRADVRHHASTRTRPASRTSIASRTSRRWWPQEEPAE